MILVDEGHHLPCSKFFNVIEFLVAKYRYMLSATPNRRDELDPIIYHAIGPAIANISKQEVENLGSTLPEIVIPIQTGFNPDRNNKKFKNDSSIGLKSYYLIQVQGNFKLGLTATSARKNGAKAEFTAAGWVYQNKKDAEEIAKRWTQEKRKLCVIPWTDSRLDNIWNGSKDEARLAKKSIKLEIDSDRLNKRRQEIILQCHQSPLHPSWLYAENISKLEAGGCSEEEKQAYEYFKPIWDKALEYENEIDLRKSDIEREEEDIEDEILKELILNPKTPLDSAEKLLENHYTDEYAYKTIHYCGDAFWEWNELCYEELRPNRVRQIIYNFLKKSKIQGKDSNGGTSLVNFNPNQNKVNNVLDAFKAICECKLVPESGISWIEKNKSPEAHNLIVFNNGILDIEKWLVDRNSRSIAFHSTHQI